MSENKLKSCPFCGGEAHFVTKSNICNNAGVGFSYIIECSACQCTPIQTARTISIWLARNGEIKITETSKSIMKQMVDEWNTRYEGAE